jgi:hypothetical protein
MPKGCRDSEGLEGLAHSDFIGEHDARALLEHLERPKDGVLLPFDVALRDPVLLGAGAQPQKPPKPLPRADGHALASL